MADDATPPWLVGFAMLVWVRSVAGPEVAILRVAILSSEGIQRSQGISGESQARVLGEALGAVWAAATVALERR